ncbi:sugar ABC transporter ATP-binding protein [Nocardioides sp. P86]|uniref:sugar ABC transporter ATP-binding protein n=1 Tax=Nocardioides sp. P86 TaxID=2939569 RepID=UPI00203AC976|nr:sugar ABC transporter ATP-binding protein [Nocardioides sp. P86]MCM3516656.1 sugar ABC transporter ATP-binding protein [Nocardioides sp. P86]
MSTGTSSATAGTDSAPALDIVGLTKTFVGGHALRDVDLRIGAGEVHALLGENGSGKSTLIKTLSGFHRPDPGASIRIGGEELVTGSAASSYALGARFVHQDLGLVEDCSVSDNLAFGPGFPTRFGTIRGRAARARAARALESVGVEVDPDRHVGRLSPAQKTGVAVARALLDDESSPVHLLVLDEPTARLPEHEVEALLGIVGRVSARGIGVLYVTHRLDEVFAVATAATVLRDGVRMTTQPVAGLTRDSLLHHLLGAALEAQERPPLRSDPASEPTLSVTGLGSESLHGIDLEVRPGEVVGIAGITGSGRDSLLGTVFGARHRDHGEVRVAGRRVGADRPDRAMAAGVAYVPAERKLEGCFVDLPARENIGFGSLRSLWRGAGLSRRRERDLATDWFERLDVRPRSGTERAMSTFSGGNQQKIVYGKWFERRPALFLLDEPTQGVDVGAKAELHRALFEAAERGAAVLVSSSDTEELIALCDRVLVLRVGELVEELVGDEISAHALTRACLGIEPDQASDLMEVMESEGDPADLRHPHLTTHPPDHPVDHRSDRAAVGSLEGDLR